MTSGPERAVAATFHHLGVSAVLDPDGAALPVRVMPWQQDEDMRYETLTIRDATGVFEIQAEAFAGYGDDAVIQIGSELRKVQSHRFKDARRLVVRLDTVPA